MGSNSFFKNNDMLSILSQFLHPKDIWTMNKTIGSIGKDFMKKYLEKSIIRSINNRLRSILDGNLNKFKKILQDTQSIISGSFIMQCILDEHWQKSDIDIFISHEEIGKRLVHKKIKNPAYPEDEFTPLEDFLFIKTRWKDGHKSDRYDYSSFIKWVRDYRLKNYIFQTIQLIWKKENLYDYILQTFDFDICKNAYGIDKNGNEYIKIFNLKNLLNKETNFAFKGNVEKSMDRYLKYKERGFNFRMIDPEKTYQEIKSYLLLHTKILEFNIREVNCLKIVTYGECYSTCPFVLFPHKKHLHCHEYIDGVGYKKIIYIHA